MFYIYEWYNTETKEIFYVGKGCGERYKQVAQRNALFKEYYKNNKVDVRIIEYFEKEQDAFDAEKKRITQLKTEGQCTCNLDNGGVGGVNFVWTPEMREYKSKYNPMKQDKQRKRMSENNPMKDPEIAKKVGLKHRKIIIYKNKECYVQDVVQMTGSHKETIYQWAKRGYDSDKEPCYYKGEERNVKIPKNKLAKAVLVDGQLFDSVGQAAKFLEADPSALIRCLKGKQIYKNHKVKYANQQPSERNSE